MTAILHVITIGIFHWEVSGHGKIFLPDGWNKCLIELLMVDI